MRAGNIRRVEAIPYSPTHRHHSLWETLEQWAIRADDPQLWQRSVLNRAMAGPRQLQPHERGQVAHIVSTHEGARAFAEVKPPAEWLCVFDPVCRYGSPGRVDWVDPESPTVDPFSLYGVDSDAVPQRSGNDSLSGRQEVPPDAWDAFALNTTDYQGLSPHSFAAVRGNRPSNIPRLPNRQALLGMWIAHVANQPAAVWWAARQESLHPDYRGSIEWGLSHLHTELDRGLLRAWAYIIEAWNTSAAEDPERRWFELKRQLECHGWSSGGVRRLVTLTAPYLKVGPALMPQPVPPELGDECRASKLARIQVECPAPPHDADIPNEWLYQVVRGYRTNLEASARLCAEVGDTHRLHISPIVEDDRPEIRDFQRTRGLSGCVVTFASLFDRLVELDLQRARDEFAAWPSDDDSVFARLRLWAGGKPELVAPDVFYQLVRGLSEDVFWGSYHQRDLLLVLSSRWGELPYPDRRQIEARLLRGPAQGEGEGDDSYKERRAWAVLGRLQWLKSQRCEFSLNVDDEMAARRSDAPNWKPEHAERAAESLEMRGGFVATNTQYGPLVHEPIGSVLSKALELAGRSETNSLEEHDPFAGLCAERPKRAYLALAHAARRNEFPAWAWESFLNSSARENDPSEFSVIVAARLCRLPDTVLSQTLYPATWWLKRVSKALSKDCRESFDRTVQRFIDVVKIDPTSASSIVHGSNRARDWVTEAINSPVGHVVQAILNDVRIDSTLPDTIEPCLERIEQCLALSADPRRHAIALASHALGWFHRINPEWSERHLLSILDGNDDGDRDSLWAGFFWNPQISSPELYLRIKDGLLNVAKQGSESRDGHVQSLAYLILFGWFSSDGDGRLQWISDAEFREALLHGGDELRSHVLWQLERMLRDDEPSKRAYLQSRAPEFFNLVWPRQKSVKTSKMTVRLCELLVSHRETFAVLIDAVSPLLTKIIDGTGLHIHLRSEANEIVKAYPERFLHLLHTVLPDDIRNWPYGIGDMLELITEADATLLKDARLHELRRAWNAR